jgi:hypothetical protein
MAGLAYAASRNQHPYVFGLGVVPAGPVATPLPGQEACQSPVGIPDPIGRVTLYIGPFKAPRGPFRVSLRDGSPSGRVLASATQARRFLASGPTTFVLDRPLTGGHDVAVCVRNDGFETLEVIGDIDSHTGLAPPKRFAGRVLHNPTRTTDDLYLDGEAISGGGFEMAGEFPRERPESLLALVPTTFQHAQRFKMGGVGAWTYWLLLALAVLAAPVALGRALAAADEEDLT